MSSTDDDDLVSNDNASNSVASSDGCLVMAELSKDGGRH